MLSPHLRILLAFLLTGCQSVTIDRTGLACSNTSDCISGFVCDPTGICVARGSIGDAGDSNPGDGTTAGDDPATGDPLPGDPLPGDPLPGDPPGDPLPGDPLPGDPLSGDPLSGDPPPGDPPPGDPTPGDTFTCPQGWYDCAWGRRQKIRVDNSGRAARANIPLPVFINSDHCEIGTIKTGGEDIRFVDEDGAVLPHDVDHYDSGGVIWVSFPTIAADSDQSYVWLYYGNGAADALNQEDVWPQAYLGVWHLTDDTLDASGYGNDPSVGGGTPAVGQINGGRFFNPSNADALVIPTSTSLDTMTAFTFSAWIYRRANQSAYRSVFSRQRGTGNSNYLFWGFNDNNHIGYIDNGAIFRFDTSVQAANDTWLFYVATYNGARMRLYINGAQVDSLVATGDLVTSTESFTVGGDLNGPTSTTSNRLDAVFDEVQLQRTGRTLEWVEMQYDAQRDELLSYDTPESP